MLRLRARFLTLLLLACPASPAATLLWSVTGNLSGSLGSTSFTNAPFTFTFYIDTTQVVQPSYSPGLYQAPPEVPGSFTITGSGDFNTPDQYIFYNTACACTGLGHWQSADLLDLQDYTDLASWDLQTPIGPFSTTVTQAIGSIGTTAGVLDITGADPTFTAQYGASPAPEPASALLIGLSLVLAALLARRRREASAAFCTIRARRARMRIGG